MEQNEILANDVLNSMANDVANLSKDKAILAGKLATANKQLGKYKKLVAAYEEKEMAENLSEEENAE